MGGFLIGLGIGLVIGGSVGLLVFAFCAVSKEDDNCK